MYIRFVGGFPGIIWRLQRSCKPLPRCRTPFGSYPNVVNRATRRANLRRERMVETFPRRCSDD